MKHSHHHPAPKRGSKKDAKGQARQRSKADKMAARNMAARESRRNSADAGEAMMMLASAALFGRALRRKKVTP